MKVKTETVIERPLNEIVSRFIPLPFANDPDVFPGSNWATSYHCDVCGCADSEAILP